MTTMTGKLRCTEFLEFTAIEPILCIQCHLGVLHLGPHQVWAIDSNANDVLIVWRAPEPPEATP